MTTAEKQYQSILQNLSKIPVAHLQQVSSFLDELRKNIKSKEDNRARILALRGAWNSMSEADFKDMLHAAKSSGEQAFGRVAEL